MDEQANSTSMDPIQTMLSELEKLQSKGGDIYPEGIFAAQRFHPILPYQREDDNLFFTVTIARILQELTPYFSKEERALADTVISRSKPAFKLFQNKDGLDTYNFWQTRPSRHFPNGWFMHRLEHFRIPDDVDDTSLVFMVEDASKERVGILREKLKQHANLAYKQAFNPLHKYRNRKIYSTFFGKQMYIEFDVCVLSNLMRLILPHFSEELNEYDNDTLDFITEVIENDEHVTFPFYSAPNYPTTALILYHIARLVPVLPKQYRARLEPRIKEQLVTTIPSAQGMQKVLLTNVALKLGIKSETAELNLSALAKDPDFFFFHAGMITAFENSVAQKMAQRPFFHLRYRCEALNWTLLLENQVLRRITP